MVAWTGESDGLSDGLSAGISLNQQSNATGNDRTTAKGPTEVHRTPTDTKQTALLISIINKKIRIA